MIMTPRSNTLFHFTKSLETLKLVLAGGFWPRFCLEDMAWYGEKSPRHMAYPMVCFCDIPISRISEHIGFYGSFGIGLSREWALKNQLNPVTYLTTDSPLREAISDCLVMASWLGEDKKEDGFTTIRKIYSYIKPMAGIMMIQGKPVEKDFYQESEWRYVPDAGDFPDFLKHSEYESIESLTLANESTKKSCMLQFQPGDIRYIFVPKDSDIPAVINYLQQDLDHMSGADLKVLMSRVTSLETLNHDL